MLEILTILKSIIAVILIIILIYLLLRAVNHREVDDVHPLIPCKSHLLNQSKFLWIIPIYNEFPITDYPEWVEEMKGYESRGHILGMHGVVHNETHLPGHKDAEFGKDVSMEYIKRGMDVFKRAFGYYPKYFKAPQLICTEENIKKIGELGMEYMGVPNQRTHKVYHCNDDKLAWFMNERVIDLI